MPLFIHKFLFSKQNKLQKKLRSAIRYNDEIEKERLQEKIRKCEEDAQKYSKKYDETKTKHDNHVKRMICIQKQLNKVLTASQVMGERIDCDPEERLIQKCKLDIKFPNSYLHESIFDAMIFLI